MMLYFLIALGAWNFAVMIVYAVDKIKAIRGQYRISEACLLTLAALFGALGGVLGMILFRHKIRKPKFVSVYLMLIVQSVAVVLMCVYLL